MNRERLTRVERVLEARQRVADRLEVQLAELTRAHLDATSAASRAQEDWTRSLSVTVADECSSTDLGEAHGYAVALGLRYESLVRNAKVAEERCAAGRARLSAARTDVRKVELWRTRITDADALEERTLERKAMDELAVGRRKTG